jgi:hypothetical protein
MSQLPRGLRNCNPLNIKIGNDWKGETDKNTDGVFEQFTELKYGYRAAFIILRKYINKYHRDTIRKIVLSWSPDGDFLTLRYMNYVARESECRLDEVIDFNNKPLMVSIVKAMAMFENGIKVEQTPIVEGYEMACLV